ncbi:putative motility protein [Parasulfuritortus cantonensis]|uniref:Putative motility protein n=1 Tax=Parasulfuritortus cantonensis TaxID=2528202 RepID=A0A4R1B174_9PROT|nr:putative motility protein [Parasulfuritortus cantonensis]TCJ11744.1 putative motility protein [Parasulfuritortus cantonensis]
MMDSVSSALAASQSLTQSQVGMATLKMAVQAEQQMAAMLAQAAQSGQVLASNPAHLGQSLDTYA